MLKYLSLELRAQYAQYEHGTTAARDRENGFRHAVSSFRQVKLDYCFIFSESPLKELLFPLFGTLSFVPFLLSWCWFERSCASFYKPIQRTTVLPAISHDTEFYLEFLFLEVKLCANEVSAIRNTQCWHHYNCIFHFEEIHFGIRACCPF